VNNQQIKNVAAGFLHALQTSPETYAQWAAIEPNDTAKYASTIQNAMHLATAPTASDMEAMDGYLHDHLQDELKGFVAKHELPPRTRLLCMLKQN
jgi:hypothetical protein